MKYLALFLLLTLPALAEEIAPGISPEDYKAMDAMVTRSMAGFNKGDFKAFYADWGKMMAAVCTEEAFTNVYMKIDKARLGNLKSRKLAASRCTAGPMNALLSYDAVFDKGSKPLNINFLKEGAAWKIQQVQMGK